MEACKRRLLYTLLRLKLPVLSKQHDPQNGLAFLQDRRHNPEVEHDMVLTGHSEGLITVNVMEADDVARESQLIDLNKSCRILLGHFRHESGLLCVALGFRGRRRRCRWRPGTAAFTAADS